MHRAHHPAGAVQKATLLSVKTGGCAEDCGYCPQAARYATGVAREALLPLDAVRRAAEEAKASGATRFCMGGAWRDVPGGPALRAPARDGARGARARPRGVPDGRHARARRRPRASRRRGSPPTTTTSTRARATTARSSRRARTPSASRRSGTCATRGSRSAAAASSGSASRTTTGSTCSTRSRRSRPHPESVPINLLVPVEGTPMAAPRRRWIRSTSCAMVATARLLMPTSRVRLSAGRKDLSDAEHALCFLAGANSVFAGDRLLTTPNVEGDRDARAPRAPRPRRRDGARAPSAARLRAVTTRRVPRRGRARDASSDLAARGPRARRRSASRASTSSRTTTSACGAIPAWWPRPQAALARAGAGAGAARLLGGDDPEHRALEAAAAALHGEEAARALRHGQRGQPRRSSRRLAGEGDLARLASARNHGSLVDGVRLSRAARVVVPDRDVGAVDRALAAGAGHGPPLRRGRGRPRHGRRRAPPARPRRGLPPPRRAADRRRGPRRRACSGPRRRGRRRRGRVPTTSSPRASCPCGKALGAAGGVVTSERAPSSTMLVHRARAYRLRDGAAAVDRGGGALAALAIARAEPWRRARALALAAATCGRTSRRSGRRGGGGGALSSRGSSDATTRARGRRGRAAGRGFAVRRRAAADRARGHVARAPLVPRRPRPRAISRGSSTRSRGRRRRAARLSRRRLRHRHRHGRRQDRRRGAAARGGAAARPRGPACATGSRGRPARRPTTTRRRSRALVGARPGGRSCPRRSSLRAPVSPLEAARLEGVRRARPRGRSPCPPDDAFLVVEGAGGLLVPARRAHDDRRRSFERVGAARRASSRGPTSARSTTRALTLRGGARGAGSTSRASSSRARPTEAVRDALRAHGGGAGADGRAAAR